MSFNNWMEEQGQRRVESSEVVVGLFQSGEDAHRAILQLQAEGFSADQIGAALCRDDRGAGAPIPSGKDVSPSETPSEVTPNSTTTQWEASFDYPVTGNSSLRSEAQHYEESWWDKLKHIFGAGGGGEGQIAHKDPIERRNDPDSRKFGTGEGHLEMDEVPGPSLRSNLFDYSGAAFENSLSKMGISSDRARYLSRELGRGGAVVTVRTDLRTPEAARILVQNRASLRYESGLAEETAPAQPQSRRVELFGEVLRVHQERQNDPDFTGRRAS
jgi:hypothetical protein